MFPGLVLALGGSIAWAAATVGWWLRPAPARPPFRALRAAAAVSALTMWSALGGAAWMLAVAAR